MKKVTAADVAAHIGVSRSSVSRAFTDGASIRKDKRQQIMKAAKELGYQPNFFARTLSTPSKKARSNMVAILIGDFANPFQAYLFEELSNALQAKGKMPVLLNVKQADDLDAAIMKLSGYQVDGVIAVIGSLPSDSILQCQKLALPLVTLGRSDRAGQIPSVQTDNYMAGKLAAEYFIRQSLKSIGYLAGRQDGQASNERKQGFLETLKQSGIQPIEVMEAGRYAYDAGFEAALKHQKTLQNIDAVFCACDTLALGLIDGCRQQLGIDVPRELKVIGCDNVPMAAWPGYQLTTVEQPVSKISLEAIQLLETMWSEEAEPLPVNVRVSPELVIRRT